MDHDDDDDRYHEPFTKEQHRQLIEMLEAHRATTLIFTRIGVWAKWLTSVAAGVLVLKAAISGLGIKFTWTWWR